MDIMLTGSEFKKIREQAGFTAHEVAQYFRQHGGRIASARSVYRLEEQSGVAPRYTQALRELIGHEVFDELLRRSRQTSDGSVDARATNATSPGTPNRGTSRNAARDLHETRRDEHLDDQEQGYIRFLNSLPTANNTIQWISEFREALRLLLGDVDRISIDFDYTFDLTHPGGATGTIRAAEYFDEDTGAVVLVSPERSVSSPTERILSDFRTKAFPFHMYHEPIAFEYHISGTYIGTMLLWRSKERPPISPRTQTRVTELEPFIIFMMTDLVARHQTARPSHHAFHDALTLLARESNLTEAELQVAILLLFGHSYKQIAERIHVSLDAVRKRVGRIYRKTGTASVTELFAKYFSHRMGI